MAVTIRLSRQGAKKNPNYLIVAMNSAGKRDGEYLAKIGQYFPKGKTLADKVKVDAEVLKRWIANGAQMSQTVSQLLKSFAN
jgi:small subunit ribosomal protein S16